MKTKWFMKWILRSAEWSCPFWNRYEERKRKDGIESWFINWFIRPMSCVYISVLKSMRTKKRQRTTPNPISRTSLIYQVIVSVSQLVTNKEHKGWKLIYEFWFIWPTSWDHINFRTFWKSKRKNESWFWNWFVWPLIYVIVSFLESLLTETG